jgi:hypothetical protein
MVRPQEGKKEVGWQELSAECRKAFESIGLHWHDLRHEYASRLVERRVPLSRVRDLLGHASITTTERYDNQTMEALQAAVKRLEVGKTFDATVPRAIGPEFQVSFKIGDVEPGAEGSQAEADPDLPALDDGQPTARKVEKANKNASRQTRGLQSREMYDEWYRYGDSNPGPVAENHVS